MPRDVLNLSERIPTVDGTPPRVLILEDNQDFSSLLRIFISLMNCSTTIATSYESAIQALVESEETGTPFSVATIDRRFVVGEGNDTIEILQGTTFLRYVKVEYPYIACLMISGEPITPSETLDLRDNFSLDYYLSKDKISPEKVSTGIIRAVEHCKAITNQDKSYSTKLKLIDSKENEFQISSRQLREICVKYFNEEELRDICFDLDLDYESLGGLGKTGKARELLGFARRQGRFFELVEICHQLRPRAFSNIVFNSS